ncbi:hypothetical protein ES708_30824 [subsurface metagenome]
MQVKFEALIKQITSKSLVSLDKETRLILQFQPSEDILNKLNVLHKPDELVEVVIRDEEKN